MWKTITFIDWRNIDPREILIFSQPAIVCLSFLGGVTFFGKSIREGVRMDPRLRAAIAGCLAALFLVFLLDLFGSLAALVPYQPNWPALLVFGLSGFFVGAVLAS